MNCSRLFTEILCNKTSHKKCFKFMLRHNVLQRDQLFYRRKVYKLSNNNGIKVLNKVTRFLSVLFQPLSLPMHHLPTTCRHLPTAQQLLIDNDKVADWHILSGGCYWSYTYSVMATYILFLTILSFILYSLIKFWIVSANQKPIYCFNDTQIRINEFQKILIWIDYVAKFRFTSKQYY